MNVSVILPTMGRAEQAVRCIEQMREAAGYPFELVVVVEVDRDGREYINKRVDGIVKFREEHRGPVAGWNEGSVLASGDAYVLAGDDLHFCDNWLALALDRMPACGGLVGFNDGHRDAVAEQDATHFLVTRDHLIRLQGGCFAIPVYKHYGFDNEMTMRAMRAGEFVWARDVLVEHIHPQWGTQVWDDTYQVGKPWRVIDRDLFFARRAAGFPDDFEPILKERV